MKSLACVCVLVAAPAAFAQEFAQPVLNGGAAWASDFRATSQVSDSFSFTNATNIQGIRVWGVYSGSPDPLPQDDFTIRVFNFAGGVPTTLAFPEFTNATVITRNLTGLTAGTGEAIYDITFDLGSQFPFLAGETYALSVVNDTSDELNPWRWMSSTVPETNRFERAGGANVNDDWNMLTTGSAAFELHATPVREPASMVSAIGLIGLSIAAARRKTSL